MGARQSEATRAALADFQKAEQTLRLLREDLVAASKRLRRAAKGAAVVDKLDGRVYTVEGYAADVAQSLADDLAGTADELARETPAEWRTAIKDIVATDRRILDNDMKCGSYAPGWDNKRAMKKLAGFPGFREAKARIKFWADAGKDVSRVCIEVSEGMVVGIQNVLEPKPEADGSHKVVRAREISFGKLGWYDMGNPAAERPLTGSLVSH